MKQFTIQVYAASILMLFGVLSHAQTDPCATNLKDANLKTEQGWYDEAIGLVIVTLENCDLSKNDRIQANKLLIVNYLAIDDIEAAEAAVSTILKINPNYEADKLRDPTEVVLLFQKYKPEPQLRAIVYGGFNTPLMSASQTYSVVSDDNSPGLDNYKGELGFQIAVGVEYRLYKQLWFQGVFQLRKTNYDIDIPNIEGRTVSYEEDLTYLEIPLTAKYYFLKSRFQPFIHAGANFSFLNSALGELTRDDVNDIVNRLPQRNSFYLGVIGGVGLSYSIKGFGFQLGANYLYNSQNVNKEGTRYDNLNTVFKYYFVDNDFTMDDVQINIGITYALKYKNVNTSISK
jgi:hypothetical protein